MTAAAGPDAILFHSRDRARCLELWVVLDAAGIPASIAERHGRCFLHVPADDLSRAVDELDDYRRELSRRPATEPALRTYGGGWLGILLYGVVLVTVAGFEDRNLFGADWLGLGRAQAGLVTGGQSWRAVTALTLHVDWSHLMGNLFFGSVLGFLVSQALGGGVAWLTILAGGVLGNVINAWVQPPTHSAVGASTAVFAALGLLVGLALRHRQHHGRNAFSRWSPLVAGLLLLAWTGVGGERTDVMAHVTGLVSGAALGLACGWLPSRLLERQPVQVVAGLSALALTALAWFVAWSASLA